MSLLTDCCRDKVVKNGSGGMLLLIWGRVCADMSLKPVCLDPAKPVSGVTVAFGLCGRRQHTHHSLTWPDWSTPMQPPPPPKKKQTKKTHTSPLNPPTDAYLLLPLVWCHFCLVHSSGAETWRQTFAQETEGPALCFIMQNYTHRLQLLYYLSIVKILPINIALS